MLSSCIRNRKEKYQFYPKIGTINEKVNTILISPKTLTSYFDVALNKRNAGQGLYSMYGRFHATIQYLWLSENGF